MTQERDAEKSISWYSNDFWYCLLKIYSLGFDFSKCTKKTFTFPSTPKSPIPFTYNMRCGDKQNTFLVSEWILLCLWESTMQLCVLSCLHTILVEKRKIDFSFCFLTSIVFRAVIHRRSGDKNFLISGKNEGRWKPLITMKFFKLKTIIFLKGKCWTIWMEGLINRSSLSIFTNLAFFYFFCNNLKETYCYNKKIQIINNSKEWVYTKTTEERFLRRN